MTEAERLDTQRPGPDVYSDAHALYLLLYSLTTALDLQGAPGSSSDT